MVLFTFPPFQSTWEKTGRTDGRTDIALINCLCSFDAQTTLLFSIIPVNHSRYGYLPKFLLCCLSWTNSKIIIEFEMMTDTQAAPEIYWSCCMPHTLAAGKRRVAFESGRSRSRVAPALQPACCVQGRLTHITSETNKCTSSKILQGLVYISIWYLLRTQPTLACPPLTRLYFACDPKTPLLLLDARPLKTV